MSQVEGLFRPVVQDDGRVVVEQVPLTREALLNPQVNETLSQTRPHQRTLYELADVLTRFFEGRGTEFSVYSNLFIRWEHVGERNVVPDLFVAKGVPNPELIDDVFDPVELGVEPCLVLEVVSTSCRIMEEKDTVDNPPVFARRGVEDLVLVYPQREEPVRLDVRRLTPEKTYRPNSPQEDGWILLPAAFRRFAHQGL
jgi:Uma2 family endonuclease